MKTNKTVVSKNSDFLSVEQAFCDLCAEFFNEPTGYEESARLLCDIEIVVKQKSKMCPCGVEE